MITLKHYFGSKPHTLEHEADARDLLQRVEALKAEAEADGKFVREIDPDTGSEISGSKGGAGDGGFRLQTATTGAPMSSHKRAKAVDNYDPKDWLDQWLDQFEDGEGGNSKLEQHGLYREHPSATRGWCHLSIQAPGSGRRTFYP